MAWTTTFPFRSARFALRSALLGFVILLASATLATAVEPQLIDPTPGATGPAGTFRDANGDLWISDHAGICRVEAPDGTPGSLVPSPYCDPTALVGITGAVAPGQLAFDAIREFIYVGDGASNSGGVWRFHLDETQNPAVIDGAVKIADFSNPLVGDRVFGMSYHRDNGQAYHGGQDWLDFSTKNSPNILRIVDPHTCPDYTAPGACAIDPMGSAIDPATSSLAHDAAGNLYVADLPGVTVITANSADTSAHSVPGLNLGAYSALTYDPFKDGGRIYAGTTNPEGVDWVDVLKVSTGQTATYSVGYDGVTTLGLQGSTGYLDVFDDPGIKQVGEDLGGTARLFHAPFTNFAPAPTVIDAPQPVTNGQIVTFSFTYPNSVTFYCVLDSGPAEVCGADVTASLKTYNGVGHGAHTFQVIADDPAVGARTIRRFTIDTRAPVTQIDNVIVTGQNVEARFSADDLNVDFACSLNGAVPTPCDNPLRVTGLPNGLHSLTVHATDFVGNVGPAVQTTFRVGPPPPPAWKPGKVTATLNGTRLRVVFNAPPGARFARFTLSRKGVYPVRTKVVAVKAGKRNVITVILPRTAAKRLQGKKTVVVKVVAGTTKSVMATNAGTGRLTIAAPIRLGVN